MDFILDNLILLLIPIISAFVGWITNFLAVKMMFYPIKFVGFRPIFGWQGLIPARAKRMAEIEVELVLGRLLSIEEIAGRLDSDKILPLVDRRLKQVLRKVVDEVMEKSAPQLWAMLPIQAKDIIISRLEQDMPRVVHDMVRDFQLNVNEILDIKTIIVDQITREPELANEIFLRSGAKEFPFIERSGFYFGFLFGIPTMFVWYWFQLWWILPLGGLLVGHATNWIALQIIFEPKRPKKFGPITIQGMFLKRQKEVAKVYANIVQEKLFNAKVITDAILKGSGADQLFELVELHVKDAIDRHLSITQPYFTLGIGTDSYYQLKRDACEQLFQHSEKFLLYSLDYADDALNIENDLCEKMQKLSPEEFEGVLRPAYKQDEWKLILTGAILGGLAGYLQLILMQ